MSIRAATPAKQAPFPTSWHSQLRIMDNLCLSIKIISHHLKQAADQSQKTDIEKVQTALQRGLITFMQKELKANGYTSDIMAEVLLPQDNAGDPLASDHYTFGILYLIQDLLTSLDHSELHNVVINNTLKIARAATDSLVQAKAFELLACMSRKADIGQTTSQLVEQCLEYEDWPVETRDVAAIQWELMSVKALQMEQYLKRVRAESRKLGDWSGSMVSLIPTYIHMVY